MALFADHELTTIQDLAEVDHNVLTIAGVEGIDLTKKIALAQQLLLEDMSRVLAREFESNVVYGVDQIVRTPNLRLCHIFKAIELSYQEAFAGQGLERYDRCRATYAWEAQRALDGEVVRGFSIAAKPLSRPASPVLTLGSGLGPTGPIEIAISWTNEWGEESVSGTPAVVENNSGVSIGVERPKAVAHATGWMVYANYPTQRLVRQSGVLGLEELWIVSGPLTELGLNEGGQTGNHVVHLSQGGNILRRG